MRVGGKPFARAVRTKSDVVMSSIDERMRRVRYAIVLNPSTSAGTSMCHTVPQPATGSSDEPNAEFKLTSTSWLNAATTKLGTEMPTITANMITTSGNRLR